MSTSAEARSARVRSALQLLREEPELVGVVLYLIAEGVIHVPSSATASKGHLSLDLLSEFSGVPPRAIRGRWPELVRVDFFGRAHVEIADVPLMLHGLKRDRTDFAPAVPRALPPAPQSHPARF